MQQEPPQGPQVVMPSPVPQSIVLELDEGTITKEDGSTQHVKMLVMKTYGPTGLAITYMDLDFAAKLGTSMIEKVKEGRSGLSVVRDLPSLPKDFLKGE